MKAFTQKSMIILIFTLISILVILPSVVFADGEEVTLRASINPNDGGTVLIDSTQAASMFPWWNSSVTATIGETHTYTAQPTSRYAFKEWQNSAGVTVSTSNPYQITVTEDTNLVAVFVRKHTITFNSNNGSQVPNQEVIRGNTVIRPEDPTRTGYIFDGWYSNRQLTTEFDFSTQIEHSITLYAKWKRAYDVTFNSNGGSAIESQKVGEGDKATLPTNPEREGYEFIGWSINTAIIDEDTGILTGTLFDFNTGINGNTTLVANWAKKHTVNFMSTSFMVPFSTEPILVTAGEAIPDVVGSIIPEYYGSFKLEGLYTDMQLSTQYLGEPITNDITIFLKWELDPDRLISEIDIIVANPTVGDEVIINKDEDGDWIWSTQTPQLEITIPEGANYSLSDGNGNYNYMYWMTSLDDENYWDPFMGTIESGTDYYVEIVLLANQGYFFSDNVVVKVNDKIIDKIYYNDGYDISIGAVLTTDKFEYVILEGENQTHIISSGDDLTVKANGDISKFEGLKVDGVLLDSSNYTVISGSTIATLNQDYLDTLEEGTHTLTFVYTDGEVSTEFTIAKAKSLSPKTGDNVELWAALMIISVLGAVGTTKFMKKD